MSEFHYVRTLGVDGGVDACDGPAIGVDLATILQDGLPPQNIALEIIAAMCEILDIADEDGEVHGDILPEYVFLDDTGAVSIEGFGTERDSSRAPEGAPDGTFTDLYGLGYTAFKLLTTEPLEPTLDDPDAHDDEVIDAIIGLNFGPIPEDFHGDIQWFLAKLMGWETDDRPPAVEVWKAFIAFADETEGPLLEDWAPDAIEGSGERRDAATSARLEPPEHLDEDLDGPTKMKGPLAKGAIDFGSGGAKAGSATAFWSKDAMKAALAAEETEEEEEDAANFRPSAASATAFWSKSEVEDARQAPKRGGGRAGARAPKATPPPGPSAQQRGGGIQEPGTSFMQRDVPQRPEPEPPPQPPVAQPPGGHPPIAQAPGAGMPPRPPPMHPADMPVDEGGPNMMVIGAVVAVFIVLCLGVGGLVGVGVLLSNGDDATEVEVDDTDRDTERRVRDTAPDKPEPKPEPEPEPEPVRPAPTPRPSPAPSPRPSPRPAPRPSPSPAPAPSSGPVAVNFTIGQRATVGCSDGQRMEIDGSKRMEFEGYNLPVSCMVEVSGGMWAGLLDKGGTVRCSGSGASFSCSGP